MTDDGAHGRRTVLAGAGLLLGAGCLGAERTPATSDSDWRMYGRDPGRSRFVPDASLPRDGVDIAWEQSVSASGWYPPVVANGTVYCQYANGLFVLDEATGEGTNVSTTGPFGRGIGPMAFGSTELYRDGALIVPYGEHVGGYAADPDGWPDSLSGIGQERVRWWIDGETVGASPPRRSAVESEWLDSPLVVDDTVVSLHPFSETLSAGTTDDGSNRWRHDLSTVAADGHVGESVGHVVETTTELAVVKLTHRREGSGLSVPLLAGIDLADGSLEWRTQTDAVSESDDIPAVVPADSLAARDGTVYTVDWADSNRTLRFCELAVATGELGWTRSLDRTEHVGIAVDETRIYHVGAVEAEEGSDPLHITVLGRDDGAVQWENTIDETSSAPWTHRTPPPTVADEHLLVPSEMGLHAFERAAGEELWTFTETAPTSGGSETERSGLTPPVVAGDRIVIGTTLVLYGLD